MSNENKPLKKEGIVNDDENISNVQPEPETEPENLTEETDADSATDDPATDDDTGGTTPNNKPRG